MIYTTILFLSINLLTGGSYHYKVAEISPIQTTISENENEDTNDNSQLSINEQWSVYFEEQGCAAYEVEEGANISCPGINFTNTNLPNSPINLNQLENVTFWNTSNFDFNNFINVKEYKEIILYDSGLSDLNFLTGATLIGIENDFENNTISDISVLDTLTINSPMRAYIRLNGNNVSVYPDKDGNICTYFSNGDVYSEVLDGYCEEDEPTRR